MVYKPRFTICVSIYINTIYYDSGLYHTVYSVEQSHRKESIPHDIPRIPYENNDIRSSEFPANDPQQGIVRSSKNDVYAESNDVNWGPEINSQHVSGSSSILLTASESQRTLSHLRTVAQSTPSTIQYLLKV